MKIKAPTGLTWVDDCISHDICVLRIGAADSYVLTLGVKVVVTLTCINTFSNLYNITITGGVNRLLNSAKRVREASTTGVIWTIHINIYYPRPIGYVS